MLGTLGRFPFAEPTSSAAGLGGAKGSFLSQKGFLAAQGAQRQPAAQFPARSSGARSLSIQAQSVADVDARNNLAANRRPQQAPEHLTVGVVMLEAPQCPACRFWGQHRL